MFEDRGIAVMRSELETMEASDHPNITEILQLLESDTNIFIVMEFVPGGDLRKVFNENMERFTTKMICCIIK